MLNRRDSRNDEKISALIRDSVDGGELEEDTEKRILEGIRRKAASEAEDTGSIPSVKRGGFVRFAVPAAACLALIASALLALHVSRSGTETVTDDLKPEIATLERATEQVPFAEATGRTNTDTGGPEGTFPSEETYSPDPAPESPEDTGPDSEAPGQPGTVDTSLPSGGYETGPLGDGYPSVTESAGDRLVLSIPDQQNFLMSNGETLHVGTEISDAEAVEYFRKNLTGIADTLSQSGVPVQDLYFSKTGYCHMILGSETEVPLIILDTRTYLAYSGEKLVAIVDLVKRDGSISWEVIFGTEWLDGFGGFLSKYSGQKIAFAYIDGTEIAISPYGEYFCPSGSGDSGILGIFSPYVYICKDSNAVFVP